jgi:hypothetical protein
MKLRLVAVAAATAFIGCAGQAHAAFVSTTTEPNGELKFFVDVHNSDTSSFTGIVGSNTSGPIVNVSTNGNVDTGSGYATIKPASHDTTLTDLTFTPENDTLFSDFFFHAQLVEAGDITLKVTDALGLLQTFTFSGIPKSADSGPFGIMLADLGDTDTIKMVELISDGFKEVKQIDWSTSSVSAVPLPASLPMFGVGMLALGFLSVTKRRKSTVPLQ